LFAFSTDHPPDHERCPFQCVPASPLRRRSFFISICFNPQAHQTTPNGPFFPPPPGGPKRLQCRRPFFIFLLRLDPVYPPSRLHSTRQTRGPSSQCLCLPKWLIGGLHGTAPRTTHTPTFCPCIIAHLRISFPHSFPPPIVSSVPFDLPCLKTFHVFWEGMVVPTVFPFPLFVFSPSLIPLFPFIPLS